MFGLRSDYVSSTSIFITIYIDPQVSPSSSAQVSHIPRVPALNYGRSNRRNVTWQCRNFTAIVGNGSDSCLRLSHSLFLKIVHLQSFGISPFFSLEVQAVVPSYNIAKELFYQASPHGIKSVRGNLIISARVAASTPSWKPCKENTIASLRRPMGPKELKMCNLQSIYYSLPATP